MVLQNYLYRKRVANWLLLIKYEIKHRRLMKQLAAAMLSRLPIAGWGLIYRKLRPLC